MFPFLTLILVIEIGREINEKNSSKESAYFEVDLICSNWKSRRECLK